MTIDQEYLSHERQIKSFILQILRIEDKKEPNIYFSEIGKASAAHCGAYDAMKNRFRGKGVTAKNVLQYYEKVNKR